MRNRGREPIGKAPSPTAGRIPELDAIRGLSALAILITHLPRGFWFGETAVDLFFVLSGYLITGIILKNAHKPHFLRTFYLRRSFRIWPIYYLTLAAVVLLNCVRHTPEPTNALPYYALYLQNIWHYWGGTAPAFGLSFGHTWTLAIEEQFYMIWPPLLMLIGRKYVTPTSIAFAVLPAVLRGCGLSREVLFAHTDGLALGALLASLRPDGSRRWSVREIRICQALCIVPFALYWCLWLALSSRGFTGKQMVSYNPSIILISLSYLGLVSLLVASVGAPCWRWLRWQPLVYLGQISYGLYLYHWVVYEKVDLAIKFRLALGEPWWSDILKVAASFAVSVFSWHCVEQPILTFKDRLAGYGGKPDPNQGGKITSREDAAAPALPRQPDEAEPVSVGGTR